MNLNNKGIYNDEERQFSLNKFIARFPNAVNQDLCSAFVNYFNTISEQGLTISSVQDTGVPESIRKDEVIRVPAGLPMRCFPIGICQPLWKNISECFNIYYNEYNIDQNLTSYSFKIHRVLPKGGYHMWHYEHDFENSYRVLAWHLTVEAPKGGGETEFLFQSMRVEPKVGQLSIWPATFTHKHRGNPPLEGQKTYLTGWFEATPIIKSENSV